MKISYLFFPLITSLFSSLHIAQSYSIDNRIISKGHTPQNLTLKIWSILDTLKRGSF